MKVIDFSSQINRRHEVEKMMVVEGDYLVIKIPDNDFSETYEIPLRDLNNANGIVSWAFHLTGKSWMSTDMLRTFIRYASDHAGVAL